jgi:hypothetical protein
MTQTYLKNDNNKNTVLNPIYSYNNKLDRRQPLNTIRSADQIPLNLFVDPNILNQLKNNPYSLPSYFGSK